MSNPEREHQSSGMNLTDIYYVLFRHKWMILLFSAAGILGAAVIYFIEPAMYSSEAELLIPYVLETKLPSGGGADQPITVSTGGNALNSEIPILTSLDLASQVVDVIGADRILARAGGGTNRYLAAAFIKKHLKVDPLPETAVLQIVFQHPDRDIVQPVLSQLITNYLSKHMELHRNPHLFDDVLQRQQDDLKHKLSDAEDQLRRLKTKAGVISSLEDSKKAYTEQLAKIGEDQAATQAELAQQQAALNELKKLLPGKSEDTGTNSVVPPEKMSDFRRISALLDSYYKQDQSLSSWATPEMPIVKTLHEQIAEAEKKKKELVDKYPKLADLEAAATKTATPVIDLSAAQAQITGLQQKLNALNLQAQQVMTNAAVLAAAEPEITDWQRQRDLLETQLRNNSSSLEQTRFTDQLGAGKNTNIGVAQAPSPPFRESRQLVKLLAMVVAGGVFGGIGLAFLIEMYLDRTVKRPIEIETRLRLPLFLSIPNTGRNGRPRLPKPSDNGHLCLPAPAGQTGAVETSDAGKSDGAEVAPWDDGHSLRRFYEALRDRLVTYFEVRNLTHKPKLVAVTGCSKGAGVTTIAAGLAATLSETGDGNVLLVDMNLEQGAAHPFHKGKPGCGLDDALENEKRDSALVQDNLYVVTEGTNGDKLPRIMPKRFSHLMPKLKASDYDYIIFDMPPVSQISVTPRLAGFMDMVLLVVESERTDRDAVKRATAMLAESKANVSAILNKTRTYVPRRLHQEFLSGS